MLFAALISAVAWDYFFVSPRMSFAVLDFDDILLLGIYFVVALIAGQLTTYIRSMRSCRRSGAPPNAVRHRIPRAQDAALRAALGLGEGGHR